MINQVALTGRLTREVDLRYTQGGTAVASFTLAVDRNFTNAQGERESDFINCVIWRKSAENFSNFTRKAHWLVSKAGFKHGPTTTLRDSVCS